MGITSHQYDSFESNDTLYESLRLDRVTRFCNLDFGSRKFNRAGFSNVDKFTLSSVAQFVFRFFKYSSICFSLFQIQPNSGFHFFKCSLFGFSNVTQLAFSNVAQFRFQIKPNSLFEMQTMPGLHLFKYNSFHVFKYSSFRFFKSSPFLFFAFPNVVQFGFSTVGQLFFFYFPSLTQLDFRFFKCSPIRQFYSIQQTCSQLIPNHREGKRKPTILYFPSHK